MTYLRPYQMEAQEKILSELSGQNRKSTLCVLPTGCGKTEVGLSVMDEWDDGKCLWLAHRQELIWQPWNRWHKKTGEYGEMEMGDYRKTPHSKSNVCFASKDSLCRPDRLRAAYPDPKEVGLIFIDEAHHSVRNNKTYQRILDYFPHAKIVGLTATPDRTDEQALGQTFESVAFDFPLLDPSGGPSAIGDGWLVPIQQELVVVDGLDFDSVGRAGGDFIGSQLETIMQEEKILHRLVSVTQEVAQGQTTLVFAAGVDQATRSAEIFNRHNSGDAVAIVSRIAYDSTSDIIHSGDRESRQEALIQWGKGKFPYLVNCLVFTEGMDEPNIRVMAMGRPTQSRSLYAQMAGRGTRILPNIIEKFGPNGMERLDSIVERKRAIAESDKPCVRVLDFVGNSRHKLMCSLDILGGDYPDVIVDLAKEMVAKKEGAYDSREALEIAMEEHLAKERQREAREREEASRRERRAIKGRARYKTQIVDPFSVLGVVIKREPGWHKGRLPSSGQKRALNNMGVQAHELSNMSFHEASCLIESMIERRKEGLATLKQCRLLEKFGSGTQGLTFDDASAKITAIANNGWKPV